MTCNVNSYGQVRSSCAFAYAYVVALTSENQALARGFLKARFMTV